MQKVIEIALDFQSCSSPFLADGVELIVEDFQGSKERR